ncbi:MAG: helix-turn-helix transcriptional regulator [Alphaproteobacteria bacterium]|nr:helix-turn-helix transcriptional regulator [Alphaproteobacteria bacterium]MBU1550578.1 helix-turn-helix transcriptional regulator [Alphaproteobacteria bacterium]MBU2338714.1 helix-turn-helix transcriptional regulator [Alphaproteobacteria bacterium]MBU2386805.1 helix-turn-helix transcriptional regulator [Alphaproteobacteria bacterium]
MLTFRKKALKSSIRTRRRVSVSQAIAAEKTSDPSRGIPDEIDPAIEALVRGIIGQVADKWTMLILEVLEEQGTLRFTEVGRHVGGISQKMLTKTLRDMERDGLVSRTVHPVIPPHVDYTLTDLGHSLGEAFCGVWIWAEKHHATIEAARAAFAARTGR